jgi:hypothetical protein
MAKKPEDRYPSAGDFGRAAVAAAREHSLPDVQGSVATGQAAAPGDAAQDGSEATSVRTRGAGAATAAGGTAAGGTAAGVTAAGATASGGAATAAPGSSPTTATPTDAAAIAGGGRKRPSIALIAGGVTLLVAIVVAVVVLSSSSSSSPTSDPRKEVQAASSSFIAASGSSTCDLATPAYIARTYTTMAACRKELSGASSESVVGPHTTSVAGSRATDAFNSTDGDHYSLVLVKQGDKWLVDKFADDTDDVKSAAQAYEGARGSKVCSLVTPRLKAASLRGANCEAATADFKPAKTSAQQVTATSTRATDKLTFDGTPATLTLVKVNDNWLVDSDTALK